MNMLSTQMLEALQKTHSITDLSSRVIAYIRSGLNLGEIPRDEVLSADQEAYSHELARRISEAADEI